MASPSTTVKEHGADKPPRRSTRLSISIPITISGNDASGREFEENARTVVVNKHGAKIATSHELKLGTVLEVENRSLKLKTQGTVVWLSNPPAPHKPWEIGVALAEAANIWGIEFPPGDWQEGAPTGKGGRKLDPGALPPPPQAEPPAPQASEPAQAKPAAQPAGPVDAPSSVPPASPAAGPNPQTEKPPASADTALNGFVKRMEESMAAQTALFIERLTKLAQQVGLDTQLRLNDAASRLEKQVTQSIEPKIRALIQDLQRSKGEAEHTTRKLEEAQALLAAEVEKAQKNIQQAGWQALQGATEELRDRIQSEIAGVSGDCVAAIRTQVGSASASAVQMSVQEASGRLAGLANEFAEKRQAEFQAAESQAIDQASEKVRQAAEKAAGERLEQLASQSRELAAEMAAQMEKAAGTSREQAVKEAAELLRAKTEALRAEFHDDFRKQTEEARKALREEMKATWKGLAEDARKQLASFVTATVNSLNRESETGIEGFRAKLRQSTQELQAQSSRELEAFVRDALAKQREELAAALQEASAQTLEQAETRFKGLSEQTLGETTQTVGQTVESEVAHLQETAERVRGQADEAARNLEQSARASSEGFEKQLAEFSTSHLEKVRQEGTALGEEFRAAFREAAREEHEKGLETIRRQLDSSSARVLEQAAGQLSKLTEENHRLLTERLAQEKKRLLDEAEEDLRGKLAGVFSSFLNTASQKTTAPEHPKPEDKR